MRELYTLGVSIYGLLISIAALFGGKAKKWKEGRKNYFQRLPPNLNGCVWVHCASLGEFEQGRPVIEALRTKSTQKILLTFFSPSGYEIRKTYKEVDAVVYIPLDTKSNAVNFLNHFNPCRAIFVKYEVWHNFYQELHKREVPTILISAIFRREQIYFKSYGSWFLDTLRRVNHIYCQDENSQSLLKAMGLRNASVAGDTRFDRVDALAKKVQPISKIQAWLKGRKAIIAGSTWPADETLIAELVNNLPKEMAIILAPHEVQDGKIDKLKTQFKGANLFTTWREDNEPNQIMIIDTIGLLSSLYQYGIIAYVGGGFGSGIHNTLEPATYGIPVIFGPKYQKFREAVELIDLGAAISVNSQESLNKSINLFLNDDLKRERCGKMAANYVQSNAGATEKILGQIMD
ncbi:MAG: 3-deoxy-D-manno-octulosonic acid transferase [Flavobacteriales bacterium]|nr:3-deoxy-D-manno-octulosonic acid transferase [Flavobacteriales bacterium]